MELTRRELISLTLKSGLAYTLPSLPEAANAAERRASSHAESASTDARPWVFWMWFNGNISRETLTADLEAMHEIGIGGALIMTIGSGPAGPVHYMTPEWQSLAHHAIAEAGRLGLKIDFNNDDGWDIAGPWIKPEEAMQKLVWSETHFSGGQRVDLTLKQSETIRDFYREVAVLAVPAPVGSAVTLPKPTITVEPVAPLTITHDYGAAITARSVAVDFRFSGEFKPIPITWELHASDDGVAYRRVYAFDNLWRAAQIQWQTRLQTDVRIAPTTARYFRLIVPFVHTARNEPLNDGKLRGPKRAQFSLDSCERLTEWPTKAAHRYQYGAALWQPDRYENSWRDPFRELGRNVAGQPAIGSVIASAKIIDLTAQTHDGQLAWDAPTGDWLILRIGHTLTGNQNRIAPPDGRGLNIDTLNKTGIEAHFPHVMETLLKQSGPLAGKNKTLTHFHADSWECGPQNWTFGMAAEFERRRGYSLVPYLPVLCGGHIVNSVDESERFLWDWRRTIADMIADNMWGRMAELCHQHGVLMSGEGAGRGSFMPDPLLYLSKVDMPMGEFWPGEPDLRPDCRLAASVANSFGRAMAGAESYTSMGLNNYPDAGVWNDSPYSLKRLGDQAFARGINHFVFHRYMAQPTLNARPGNTWISEPGTGEVGIGINMERTQTWWKSARGWMGYLTRCQEILRRGHTVTDVAALVSDGIPAWLYRPRGLTDGYTYDGLHPSQLQHMTVIDGRMVLPSGAEYRVLVLPELDTMTPETAVHVERLIRAGATVCGTRPAKSPSLRNYPHADEELGRITSRWGRIFPGVTEALAHLHLGEDFHVDTDARILYRHRRWQGGESYFIANQEDKEVRAMFRFRATGKLPEVLDPDTGEASAAGTFRADGTYTYVPLTLAPRNSLFVLFQKTALSDQADVMRTSQGSFIGANLDSAFGGIAALRLNENTQYLMSSEAQPHGGLAVPAPVHLDGPWNLRFPAGAGAPEALAMPVLAPLHTQADPRFRFFSGTVRYEMKFDVPSENLSNNVAAFLDLGDVGVIAEAWLNSHPLGVRWKMPFRYEITHKLAAKGNVLAIEVSNLWRNRLIGDSGLPPENRIAQTNFNPYTPSSELAPSGLLGPVRIVSLSREVLETATTAAIR